MVKDNHCAAHRLHKVLEPADHVVDASAAPMIPELGTLTEAKGVKGIVNLAGCIFHPVKMDRLVQLQASDAPHCPFRSLFQEGQPYLVVSAGQGVVDDLPEQG